MTRLSPVVIYPCPAELRALSRQRRSTVRWLGVAFGFLAVGAGMAVAWGLQ